MYDPISIFIIVWGLFSVGSAFPSLVFCLENFLWHVVKLVWWCWILLTFFCLESFWFLHQIWRRVLLGRVFLVVNFFPFITLNMSCHSLLACRVSVEKSADSLTGVSWCVICHFSFLAFNILSLSLIFVSLITMCLGVFLFRFILPGNLCAAWTSLFPFPCQGSFQLLSLQIFSQVLSLFSWDPSDANVGAFNVVPEVSQAVFNSFHSFF